MSGMLNVKSNELLIYAYLGFHVCRDEADVYENCLRTGTAGRRSPTECYDQSKKFTKCVQDKATKLDPISIPIFNDVRECLFQNDSHMFNCKEQLNQLLESHINPTNYKEMLLASTPAQLKQKRYDTSMYYGVDDLN